MDFLASIILLALFELALFLAYKALVYVANQRLMVNFTDLRKEIVDGEIAEKGIKVTLKLKDWFNWNIQTNNEKGTAGGNIKINFPVKSALGLAIICFILCILSATFKVTAYLVPLIMLSFGVYYLIKWWRALQLVKSLDEWFQNSEIYAFTKKRLYRSPNKYILGGVCSGLSEYTGIGVGITRITFIVITFATGGIAAAGYGLLWIVVPNTPAEKKESS